MKSVALLVSALLVSSTVFAVPAGTEMTPAVGVSGPSGEQAALAAIPSFKVDPALKVSLFAAEPLLANGVAFAQNEQGVWYVAETYRQEKGVEDNRSHLKWLVDDLASRSTADRLAMMHKFYPDPAKFAAKFTTEQERIIRLEDPGHSGRAEKTTIVADGFRDPLDGTGAGLLVRGHDLWWTCIPNLWHFRLGADGKAETREPLLSGFGVRFAFRGHDMHGLRFGPDGKLYFSIGDRGLNVTSKEGGNVSETESGAILRCNPDGTGLEIFATGVRNPQELAFDELGNLFTGDNNSDSGDKARFAYLVEGGDSGWRMAFQYLPDRGPWNREMLWDPKEALKAKYLIPPIANVGNGPSGLTYNPGTGLSEGHYGRFYLADFRGGSAASLVHEIQLTPDGAFFRLKEDRDFVKGILNTDVEFGHDGKLYVLDWVESWGGVEKGRIYQFADPAGNSTLQAETQKLIEEGPEHKSLAELGALLGHPDQRVRQAAQFELARRGPGSRPIFIGINQPGHLPLARLHAIWGLGQLGLGEPLLASLSDADPEVRAQAARVLGDARLVGAGEKLLSLLKDPAPRVRFYAALGVGKIRPAGALDPLLALLVENADVDPIIRHGAVMGLAGAVTAEQLAAQTAHPSPAARVGALLALRRQKSPEVARFLADAEESIVLEAARAIYDVPIEAALPALAQLSTRSNLQDPALLDRILNAHYRLGDRTNAAALAAYASDASRPEAGRREALQALAAWGSPEPLDRLLNCYRPLQLRGPEDAIAAVTSAVPALFRETSPGIQEAVATLAGELKIQGARDSLYALASNPKSAPGIRAAAVHSLGALKDSRLLEVARAAAADPDAAVRTAGLEALSTADPAAAVEAIGRVLDQAKPREKQGALSALTQIHGPAVVPLLGKLLDQLRAGQLQAEIQLDVLEAARESEQPELLEKMKAYEESLPKDDPLAADRVALSGGNVTRGKKLFREKTETQCQRCHKCETGDSQVGPDLTHIGASKDREYLLESIVTPNKRIAEGFETVVLMMKDQSVAVGRVLKSDEQAITLEVPDAQGRPVATAVPLEKVAQRMSAPSPMPENIRSFLTQSELRDLIEYLATRK